jgi:hypothetical protein
MFASQLVVTIANRKETIDPVDDLARLDSLFHGNNTLRRNVDIATWTDLVRFWTKWVELFQRKRNKNDGSDWLAGMNLYLVLDKGLATVTAFVHVSYKCKDWHP